MARLSREQLKNILRAPKTLTALSECTRHHERLRLHVEPTDEASECSPAYGRFMLQAANVLPSKKYQRFEALVRFPLPSVKVSKKIFADLKRVFDGKNRVVKHRFTEQQLTADFERFKREVVKDAEFFQEDVFETIKTGINNFIVVDLPSEQEGELPAPFAYIVKAESVIAVEVNRDNRCEYLAFKRDESTIVILDDDYYRVYRKVNDEWVVEVEELHYLGFAPVRNIWSDYMHPDKNYVQKVGPISEILSDLDDIVFWDVANRYYQMYGSFPIYWEYRTRCEYEDADGNTCDHGYINYSEVRYEVDLTTNQRIEVEPIRRQKRCPECEKNDNIGPGTVVGVNAPESKEDPDLRQPMGFVGVDKAALEFAETKQQSRIQAAIDYCVGINTGGTDQAVNPEQLSSYFEDRKSILFGVKRNLELIHHWTLDTMARLRYGKRYKSTYLSYGDEFYLRDESALSKGYAELRTAGLPSYLLAAERNILVETKFRTDEKLMARAKLLSELEPYPDFSVAELVDMRLKVPTSVNIVSLIMKMNFSDYIDRFEREELNILEFGEAADHKTKIDGIKSKLQSYAEQEFRDNEEAAEREAARDIEKEAKLARATHIQSPGAGGKPANTAGAAKGGAKRPK